MTSTTAASAFPGGMASGSNGASLPPLSKIQTENTALNTSSSWDSLRREARKLENELDMKLASYGKQYGEPHGSEIEVLIDRLQAVNASLQADARAHPSGNHGVLAQRHADILQDYSMEYKRLVSNGRALGGRLELLGGDRGAAGAGVGGRSATSSGNVNTSTQGLLLRERGTLDRAHSGIDTVVQQAYSVASGLGRQRDIFSSVDGRLGQLGSKFPVMNSMLNAIRRKKNRDTLVLSGVGGVLTFLMFVYWWQH